VFDTIAGLPLHPLAVHAVVVLLPLMSVVTALVAIRPAWRARLAVWVVIADALVVACCFVARQSGERFQARLSALGSGGTVAVSHGREGSLLPLFALALFVAAVVVWFTGRRPGLAMFGVLLAVVTGLAAIGWTVVVGDSGARAVWGSVIRSS
jgi:hypothetical protein